ncbi:hypothetical protein HYFRA_00008499 [Hymenoscyphus fraxineus]|uniref:Cytochrome P450 alkane hydroxylase n=1 Tax=Hymenoscyphus fraxineus TaxID=746836 RepID=A0A9N9KNB7_9HELO|nr:hypothetical protein HYFRA_00008499 [Hymenoscyphus fraxineus]
MNSGVRTFSHVLSSGSLVLRFGSLFLLFHLFTACLVGASGRMAYNVFTIVTFMTLVLTTRFILRSIQVALFKRKHGCQPETRIPQVDPILGYDIFRAQVEAFKNNNVLGLAYSRYQKYGLTWSLSLMGGRFYNTIETENIKTILATSFKDFGIGGRQEACRPLLGKGIFTTDGAEWEHSRALVRPNFTKAQVANLDTFESHIQKLIAHIPQDGTTFDLQPLFFQLALDSATEFLFGQSVGSFDAPQGSDQERFGKAFDLAQSRLGMRIRMGKLAWLYRDTNFDKACKEVHRFVDRIVLEALQNTPCDNPEKSFDKEGERYVFLTELIKSTRDPQVLRDQLLNILLAGRDTTASLLSNTFHALVRNPHVFQQLKAEIDTLNGKKPDYETLRNMKYLKYVLNESLRLYPPVPANARYALKDTILPLGGGTNGQHPLFIPRGGIVAYSVYALHRRTDIYGPDASEFRPERWDPSSSSSSIKNEKFLRPGWGYLPFNGGPRICVGQQYALTEAGYTIVRLIQTLGVLEGRGGEREWVPRVALTACCHKGVRVGCLRG